MFNHPPLPSPMPPPHPQRSPASTITATGDCGECGAHVARFLFHIRVRGLQRRLCTKCVLKLHPSMFCPICFAYYEVKPPHPSKRLPCSHCTSLTHTHCSTASTSQSQSPFLCSLCSSKTTTFNDFSSDKRIDAKSAAMILCAAEIASESMAKAVAVAKSEAEKKVKDAALAKKKAREALESVALLIDKTNHNDKDGSGSENFFNAVSKKESLSQSQDFTNATHAANKV